MKKIAILAILVAAVSFVLAVASKSMLVPLPILPGGVKATDFLDFTNTCLLVAITFILLELVRIRK